MKVDYESQLQAEREMLDKLVDEALHNGTSLSETHSIMKQCKKIDELIQKRNECVTQKHRE